MARASVKSPIPRPPNPLSRLFSQSSNFFTGYSSHPTFFVPTVEVSERGKGAVYHQKEGWVEYSRGPFYRRVTIGSLPDDVLLEIFDFYRRGYGPVFHKDGGDWWHTLVDVCRRWRNVVFGSPRRLYLSLLCMPNRSVKEMLDIWPELPIIISDYGWSHRAKTVENVENVIDALELKDRVSDIDLYYFSSSDLKRFAAVMHDPFPALTGLRLRSNDRMAPVISDSFLGGSAPQLQHLKLGGILFPAFPSLLLSATNLVFLCLTDIPHSGYISPEAMVACLSALTRLKTHFLEFRSPRPRPSRARPPPTRTILPSLDVFYFKGVSEYLEDLVSRIDAPLLLHFSITFFNQLVFDLLQLPKFLCRTGMFSVLDHAVVTFNGPVTHVYFSSQTKTVDMSLRLSISCWDFDWELSALSQVCNSALLALSTVEYLDFDYDFAYSYSRLIENDMENTQWLELLHPFANVKDLQLFEDVLTCIAPALRELTDERVTEVLPMLQNIFIDEYDDESEPVPEAIWEFCTKRRLSGFPITVHLRPRDSKNGHGW